jgi:hypothetical protein
MAIPKAFGCWAPVIAMVVTGARAKGAEPDLAEIAAAQAASWRQIRSFDVKYELKMSFVNDGEARFEYAAPCRWSKEGQRERLRSRLPFIGKPRFIYEDKFLDGGAMRAMSTQGSREDIDARLLDPASMHASTRPHSSPIIAEHRPRTLEYLEIGFGRHVTLSDLIARWKTSLEGKQSAENGDVLWRIRAERPGENENAPSYIEIWVNADKGFLTQRMLAYYAAGGTSAETGQRVATVQTVEIARFRDFGRGVYFPEIIEGRSGLPAGDARKQDGVYLTLAATSLVVNAPLPDDALDFRFPEGAVVREFLQDGRQGRVFLWGSGDRPRREFASGEEFDEVRTARNAESVLDEAVGFWISPKGMALATVAQLLL